MLTSKKTNNHTMKKHENNHQLLPETAIAANSVIIAGPSADEIKT